MYGHYFVQYGLRKVPTVFLLGKLVLRPSVLSAFSVLRYIGVRYSMTCFSIFEKKSWLLLIALDKKTCLQKAFGFFESLIYKV